MLKRLLFISMILVMSLPALAVQAAVCGVDGVTYDSAEAAEAAGVDVSYDFACVDVNDESKLYEATSEVNFAGMLIEVGSTDIPTNLIIRDNATQQDYTVSVDSNTILGQRRGQETKLSDWIPGDQIRVIGVKNENTGNIEATILINLSISLRSNLGANGWITKIDKEKQEITYQWMNQEHTFKYDENTHFVAGLKNPASIDDLQVNDRIRARLLVREGELPLAKIVVVLRRGKNLFMKIRTFTPRATLVRMDSTVIPTTIQVRIEKTPGLRANDVNNLIGTEGTLVTVNVTEDTRLVRKYFGITTLDEFAIGDELMIVGRVNDDGTVDAKVIKNNSVWKTNLRGYPSVVKEINTDENYLLVDWTPIKHLMRKQLKQKLQECPNCSVSAQFTNPVNPVLAKIKSRIKDRFQSIQLKNTLQERIKNSSPDKVGKFVRKIRNKKVKIERIRHAGIKLGDLIQRGETVTVKVEVTDNTKIIIGTNNEASLSDIKVGDKVRVRGTMREEGEEKVIVADKIVVVSSLPEIEDSLDTPIDDINEVVNEIVVDDEDTTTDTEEEIVTEEDNTEEVTEENTEENSEEELNTEENNEEVSEDNNENAEIVNEENTEENNTSTTTEENYSEENSETTM